MRSYHYLLFFVFDYLSIMDAVFVEIFQHGVQVLIVAVCAEGDFVFAVWLLSSFGNKFIKLIAHSLYPFTDGKGYE